MTGEKKVKAVTFRVGAVGSYSDKHVEITYDSDKYGGILPTLERVWHDIQDIYNSDNSNPDYILNECTIHYEYSLVESDLRLIDWIKKFQNEKITGYHIFKLTNTRLSANGGCLYFNVSSNSVYGKRNLISISIVFEDPVYEEEHKPSIQELLSTGWYIKND